MILLTMSCLSHKSRFHSSSTWRVFYYCRVAVFRPLFGSQLAQNIILFVRHHRSNKNCRYGWSLFVIRNVLWIHLKHERKLIRWWTRQKQNKNDDEPKLANGSWNWPCVCVCVVTWLLDVEYTYTLKSDCILVKPNARHFLKSSTRC